MEYKEFEKLIDLLKETHDRDVAAYKLGIAVDNDKLYCVIDILMKEAFGAEKEEWISWFCYDNDFGEKGLEATDNGKRICYDINSLYEYINGSI